MFAGFDEQIVDVDGVQIFVRSAGPKGALPLLLLHGYPQTSAMWHLVAPALAEEYQVICPDLRGCGRSDKPVSTSDHSPYSKRTMANDMVKLMGAFGHQRFFVGAHDRGARVAHRMGMDHPDNVAAMVLLDIAPTREMYVGTTAEFAKAYWHWFMLIQDVPLPETLIGADPDNYWKTKCFNQAGYNPFQPEALEEYLAAFRDPAVIHATCEDYRAAKTIDIVHDDADGDNKLDMPIQVLWGKTGVIEKCFDAMTLWQARADNVVGEAINSGHYMAEEIPDVIIKRFGQFFRLHENRMNEAS
ncbi:alpha/beta fold hydrolase [Kordiimonas aquimaris]|uniref:alpha/beta fold hydrolase n=1 Tax=Kordiimonas aquimaris TaxID=707591 RepID=UPI0021CFB883|nr:alpha/beta hydrolase [Kordiimonas aquimaris]